MKRIFALILSVILMTVAMQAQSLQEGFQNPPASAQPRTWWHWVSGNITKAGITADLEAMHRVGIQEAQIFNVGIAFPEGPVQYMSNEWFEMFRFAVSEADRLGMPTHRFGHFFLTESDMIIFIFRISCFFNVSLILFFNIIIIPFQPQCDTCTFTISGNGGIFFFHGNFYNINNFKTRKKRFSNTPSHILYQF